MTAEVIVMNKSAIAVASDSAMTIRNNDQSKIFNTANKIFTLSKYHPIGIMIYSQASLGGVPWETLIKVYREELDNRYFDTVEEYADDLVSFLEKNNQFFSSESETHHVLRKFSELSMEIEEHVIKKYTKGGKAKKLALVRNFINERFRILQNCSDVPNINEDYKDSVYSIVEQKLERFINKNPLLSPQSDLFKKKIRKTVLLSLTKLEAANERSGIVVFGFGRSDIFPAVKRLRIDTILNGKVIFDSKVSRITPRSRSLIIPLAQSDMIRMYMEGIYSKIEQEINNYFISTLMKIPNEFRENQELKRLLSSVCLDLIEDLPDKIRQIKYDHSVADTLDAVEFLPKEELAVMAESLVQLTSLKRRVSSSDETVGGPIDVALISKGDGFIWMKRKHYFDPSLNTPGFISNYYNKGI